MIKKIRYGYLRKVNIKTQVIKYYSYGELLLDFSKRLNLYDECTNNQSIKLYCACSEDNNLELCINNTYGFDYLNNQQHHCNCINYLHLLSKYISKKEIAPLTGCPGPIPVAFRWKKGCRSVYGFIGPAALSLNQSCMSLASFIALLNVRTFKKSASRIDNKQCTNYPTDNSFLNDITFEMGRYKLTDPKCEIITLTDKTIYKPSPAAGSTNFIYAKIINYNVTYKSKVYLACVCATGKANICLDKEKWEALKSNIITGLPLYVAGFVNTKETAMYTKGQYDSLTHSYYKSSEAKTRIESVLSSFVLFHANDYGLICFSKEEYNLGNYLCKNSIIYEKPYIPMPFLSSTLPLLFISNKDGTDYIYGSEIPSSDYYTQLNIKNFLILEENQEVLL